jgi:hypothetical protein
MRVSPWFKLLQKFRSRLIRSRVETVPPTEINLPSVPSTIMRHQHPHTNAGAPRQYGTVPCASRAFQTTTVQACSKTGTVAAGSNPSVHLVSSPRSFGLSATSRQQYFFLRTNQLPTTSQQYFSLRTKHHQPNEHAAGKPERVLRTGSLAPPAPPSKSPASTANSAGRFYPVHQDVLINHSIGLSRMAQSCVGRPQGACRCRESVMDNSRAHTANVAHIPTQLSMASCSTSAHCGLPVPRRCPPRQRVRPREPARGIS